MQEQPPKKRPYASLNPAVAAQCPEFSGFSKSKRPEQYCYCNNTMVKPMNNKIANKFNKLTLVSRCLVVLLTLSILQGYSDIMAQTKTITRPAEFVDLQESIPNIRLDVRYFSEDNFVGAVIDGYCAGKILITEAAAQALSRVQDELGSFGLGLKVFDAYRPQRAVDDFVRWAKDLGDTRMKSIYYPTVAKENLFRDGYIAEHSGHSRGSTIDLTLVDLISGEELDMGTSWDFFDPKSSPDNSQISTQGRANRNLLAAVMTKHGFKALAEEWWHFTLVDEPFPDTYFDFPVQAL